MSGFSISDSGVTGVSPSSVFSMSLSLLALNLFASFIKGMSSSISELGHSFLQNFTCLSSGFFMAEWSDAPLSVLLSSGGKHMLVTIIVCCCLEEEWATFLPAPYVDVEHDLNSGSIQLVSYDIC